MTRRDNQPERKLMSEFTRTCARSGCGHSSDWHRLDDATNVSPTDPAAEFRCLGFDPAASGPPQRRCNCPDFVDPQ